MVQSMTGFGSGEAGAFRVEVRSLNHRFMDVSIRMSSQFARFEMPLREGLKKSFQRGKFDVFVNVSGAGEMKLSLDHDAAREIHSSLSKLAGSLGLEGEVGLSELLGWKDSFISEDVSYDEGDLMSAFKQALEELKAMRFREGEALSAEVRSIVESIESRNDDIGGMCPAIMGECRNKYAERLTEVLEGSDVDEGRILQEASQLVEKSDITEEVARIRSHVSQMKEILLDGPSVGRKLDFLLQELNREVNTIASKTGDPQVLAHVIDMKAEIERAREQVQNLQ
jgi:uncharacterized protein (TIGR00255 family)